MEYRYLVSHSAQLETYRMFVEKSAARMEEFLTILMKNYHIEELPRVVVLTDCETATHLVSDIPVPAFTNEMRTVFCPELEVWRQIYLGQLTGGEPVAAARYYETELSENYVAQILGHEFVHHCGLFLDEVYEESIWFEEGLCEYISRRFFLTPEEFQREKEINSLLVSRYEAQYGTSSLECFGSATYQQGYAGIFHGYWKSFLAVDTLVKRYSGDVLTLFRAYHRWYEEQNGQTLAQWFALEE